MATLLVGPGHPFATISSAHTAASSGDTIQIEYNSGIEYFNDAFNITKTNLTFQGINGRPIVHSGAHAGPNQAIFLMKASSFNITFDNLEIFGAEDDGSAAIKFETGCDGGLIVRNCYIHHCDNGILGVIGATRDVTVEDTEFAYCCITDQIGNSHNMYVTTSGTFTVKGCYSHHCNNGMLFKSKSRITKVIASRLFDNGAGSAATDPAFSASQEIDNAWGGLMYVIGCELNKGDKLGDSDTSGCMFKYNSNYFQANSEDSNGIPGQNGSGQTFRDAIAPGGPWHSNIVDGSLVEYEGWHPKRCYIVNTTFVNEDTSLTDRFLEDAAVTTGGPTSARCQFKLLNSLMVGQQDTLPANIIDATGTLFYVDTGTYPNYVPADFFWNRTSRQFQLRRTATAAINTGASPGTGDSLSLTPTLEFDTVAGIGTRDRPVNGNLDVGAFEVPTASISTIGFGECLLLSGLPSSGWKTLFHYGDTEQTITRTHPTGKSYSGVMVGGGKIYDFGGGHQSNWGNEVGVFDCTDPTGVGWVQRYIPDSIPGGSSHPHFHPVDILDPPSNPYDIVVPGGGPFPGHMQHRFEIDPRVATGAFMVATNDFLWRYDYVANTWTRLNQTQSVPPSTVDINCHLLLWDPYLSKMLLFNWDATAGQTSVWRIDNDTGPSPDATFTIISRMPDEIKLNDFYGCYDTVRQQFVIASQGGTGHYWKFRSQDVGGPGSMAGWYELSPPAEIKGPPTCITYDPVSEVTVILRRNFSTGIVSIWTFDGTSFAQVTPSPVLPPPATPIGEELLQYFDWSPFGYDEVTRCMYFLVKVDIGGGGQGGTAEGSIQTWAMRLSSPEGTTAPTSPPTLQISSITPSTGTRSQSLDVTITGNLFQEGAVVGFSAGIIVSNTVVVDDTTITCHIDIAVDAEIGARVVSVTNPDTNSTSSSGFAVISLISLVLTDLGFQRDRVGQGNLTTADGTLDRCFRLDYGSDASRALTFAQMSSASGGIWDTQGVSGENTIYWRLGVADSLDGALHNSGVDDSINVTLGPTDSVYLFIADLVNSSFPNGLFSEGVLMTLNITIGGENRSVTTTIQTPSQTTFSGFRSFLGSLWLPDSSEDTVVAPAGFPGFNSMLFLPEAGVSETRPVFLYYARMRNS